MGNGTRPIERWLRSLKLNNGKKSVVEKILVSLEQSHLISQMNYFLMGLRYATGKKKNQTIENEWEAEFNI